MATHITGFVSTVLAAGVMFAAHHASASAAPAPTDRFWTGPATPSSWQTAGNWTPTGIPGAGDTVFIDQSADVILNLDTFGLTSLSLGNGGVLNTNTHTIFATDSVVVDQGGRLEAMLGFGSDALQTPFVHIDGGTLELLGGRVYATDRMLAAGNVFGNGTLAIPFGNPIRFRNEGTLTATGVITIQAGSGAVVLDGLTEVEEDGSLVIDAANTDITSHLRLNGDATVDIDGIATLASGALLAVDAGSETASITADILHLTPASHLAIAGAGLEIEAAMVADGQITVTGTNVVLESGAEVYGDLDLSGGTITGATIDLVGGNIEGNGAVTCTDVINDGAIIAIGGDLLVDTVAGTPDLDGAGNDESLIAATSGDLIVYGQGGAVFDVHVLALEERAVRMPGFTLALAPNSFPAPQISNGVRLRGGAFIAGGLLQPPDAGPIEIQASPIEARIESSITSILRGAVSVEGNLRLEGETHLLNDIDLFGPGLLTNGTTGHLRLEDNTVVGTALQNQGVVEVGPPGDYSTAHLMRFLTQTAPGTLMFEFAAGGDAYDIIDVDGIATLAGTIEVASFDGSELSQPMELIRAAAIVGTFEHVHIPAGATVVYTPTAVLVQPGPDCPPDINVDGEVNVLDLLEVIAGWGICCGCPPDVNNDGYVNVLDVLEVLAAWGPCA